MTWAAVASAAASVVGGYLANRSLGRGMDQIQGLSNFSPMNVNTPYGGFNFGSDGAYVNESLESQGMRSLFGGQIVDNLQGGGLFGNSPLAAAFGGNDILGALNQSNAASQLTLDPRAVSQLGAVNDLGGFFGAQALAGPQDLSGGAMNTLFSSGLANQMLAGNQQALQNQELATMRAAARPEEDRMFNRLNDRLFAMGQLGTTGGAEQMRGFSEAMSQADLGRQNAAFGRGLQRGNFLSNLGSAQIGQAGNLLGQNIGNYQGNVGNARGFLNLGAGLENNVWEQAFRNMQNQQSAGNQRLQNAMSLFGLGQGARQVDFGIAIDSANQINQQNQLGLTSILGLLNAEANRIGATQGYAQAYMGGASNQAGLLGGIFNGISGLFG